MFTTFPQTKLNFSAKLILFFTHAFFFVDLSKICLLVYSSMNILRVHLTYLIALHTCLSSHSFGSNISPPSFLQRQKKKAQYFELWLRACKDVKRSHFTMRSCVLTALGKTCFEKLFLRKENVVRQKGFYVSLYLYNVPSTVLVSISIFKHHVNLHIKILSKWTTKVNREYV